MGIDTAGLEEFLFARPNSPIVELSLDNPEAFFDFLFVHRGAVTAEEKLDDIRRDRILPAVLPDEVLADQVTVEHRGGKLVKMVQFHATGHLQWLWLSCRSRDRTHREPPG